MVILAIDINYDAGNTQKLQQHHPTVNRNNSR